MKFLLRFPAELDTVRRPIYLPYLRSTIKGDRAGYEPVHESFFIEYRRLESLFER